MDNQLEMFWNNLLEKKEKESLLRVIEFIEEEVSKLDVINID